MVSSSEILVNKESTSRLATYKLGPCLQMKNEMSLSVTVYSFSVKDVKSGS